MKISFVIPAYNEEKNIVDCIISIKNELDIFCVDHEIIVVNNNSTDRTKELALKHGAKVVDETRKGIVWARKAGFDASSGHIIANIDADNRLTKGWLETVYGHFCNRPEIVALSGPLIYYDSPAHIRIFTKVFFGIGFVFSKMLGIFIPSSMLQGGNFVIKKEEFKKVGGFDTTIEFYGEDTDVGRRLAKVGKVVWTFKLPINSSGRRLQNEGFLTMGFKYGINYLSTIFIAKPVSKKYKDIR